MSFVAYFDDVRRIDIYHDDILANLQLFKDETVLDFNTEVIAAGHTAIYLAEDVDFAKRYSFIHKEERYNIVMRHVVRTEAFDDYFACDIDKLGNFYTKQETSFRLWAPLSDSVDLVINDRYHHMSYVNRGVYSITLMGDYEKAHYYYEIKRGDEKIKVIDPYSYSSGPNASYSCVIDLDKLPRRRYKPKNYYTKPTDAVIYEMSVRDMTSAEELKTSTHGKFISLLQEVAYEGMPTGIQYIKELGITHVQLMPTMDFGRIDEKAPSGYNWGYDPIQYNVPEGTYCSDVNDPYKRVSELRQLVDYIHQKDLYVVFDVVFNHVFDSDDFALAKILPFYYFRYYGDDLANGSYCGNELRTEGLMVRRYLELMVKRYIDIYDIDGLRYDLMCLMDITTLNELTAIAKDRKSWFLSYGEAWNMEAGIPCTSRCNLNNRQLFEEVAYFNGAFRDAVRGNSYGGETRGYILGDITRKDDMAKALVNCDVAPSRLINYIECHDNKTFYDALKVFHGAETDADDRRRIKLGIAAVILAHGIPFIHAGQEFARTKGGLDDTYCAPDAINKIDYRRRLTYLDIVAFTKDMIAIRQANECLRCSELEDIANDSVYYVDEVLVYEVGNLKILFNATLEDRDYYVEGSYELLYGPDGFADQHIHDTCLTMERLTILILRRDFM